jgi:mediator of RNA polymerase II transcription subunit 18
MQPVMRSAKTACIGAPCPELSSTAAPAKVPPITHFSTPRPPTHRTVGFHIAHPRVAPGIQPSMHELLLYGQLPSPRHEQVLKILAGHAAMQPRRVLERHIIYKPTREPEEPGAHLGRGGGSQTIGGKPVKQGTVKNLFYTKLVQKLDQGDFGCAEAKPADNKRLSANVKSGEEPKWSFEFQDLPDTGDRGVSARLTASTDLLSGDPHAWMVATGPHQ